MTKPAAICVPPNEGKVFRAFGETVTIHLDGTDTGGKLTLFTEITPPGGGPPPHYHLEEDEWFYPLEGRVEFLIDGNWQEVPMGSVVFVARRVVHSFRNPGEKPLKMLIQTAPSGFEKFFARCADEFAKPGSPDMERIIAMSAEHGIHFVSE